MLRQIIARLEEGALPANHECPCLQPAGTLFPIMPPSALGFRGWESGIVTVTWSSLLWLHMDSARKCPTANANQVGFFASE